MRQNRRGTSRSPVANTTRIWWAQPTLRVILVADQLFQRFEVCLGDAERLFGQHARLAVVVQRGDAAGDPLHVDPLMLDQRVQQDWARRRDRG
jgi:hypothetical protein